MHLVSQELERGNLVEKKTALISMWYPQRTAFILAKVLIRTKMLLYNILDKRKHRI